MSIPERATLVVLHGALGAAEAMKPLVDALEPYVDACALNMVGHGGRPVPKRLSIQELANDVVEQLGERDRSSTFVFGYSAGACVALYLARHCAERFAGVSTLAAKYVFDRGTVAHWTYLADPKRLQRPELKRAPALTHLHQPQDWVGVARANVRMFQDWAQHPPLTVEEIKGINLPALMFCSDGDQLVSIDEARALGTIIPNSRVVVFRGQSHPLSVVPVAAVARAIGDWIGESTPAVDVGKEKRGAV